MPILKCKICGGSLNIEEGQDICTCEYCGTRQTLPKLDNERKLNMYDRASHLRRNSDFDKASVIYEQILSEDKTDAEAYWSLVLCKYGVEYVEDPSTHKRIPTVNRTQFTSIFNDPDYKEAINHASIDQKVIYEEEARKIDDIQRGILDISKKEEPYDIFICYKETDNNGRRTMDSVLAQDIYKELTKEGYKVFFSRITLEDRIGMAYEPYIFAALNSAKVMIVVGTSKDNFNAVWVKNEWSRYLSLMKKDDSKILVPCYRDMDPYDMPEEFAYLQAQDMSKLGFMQDLVRGIDKITGKNKKENAANSVLSNTVTPSANIEALLKRGNMFLEDGDFESANDYFNRVLDSDPENGEAYLGLLLCDYKLKSVKQLEEIKDDLSNNAYCAKAIKYLSKTSENLYKTLNDILNNNLKHIYEEKYKCFIDVFNNAKNEKDYNKVIELSIELDDNEEIKKIVQECETKIDQFRIFKEERQRKNKKTILISMSVVALIILVFGSYFLYFKPRSEYKRVMSLMNEGKYKEALIEIDGSNNIEIQSLMSECRYLYVKQLMNEGDYKNALEYLNLLGDYKDCVELLSICKLNRNIQKIKNSGIGTLVTFGEYEQDNDLTNGPEDINWIVHKIDGNKYLLVTSRVLLASKYDSSQKSGCTWDKSIVRKVLNEEFYNNAFSNEEKEYIIESMISYQNNPDYSFSSGSDTYDKVFILSIDEIEEAKNWSLAKWTEYAKAQGGYNKEDSYWLRNPGYGSLQACYFIESFAVTGTYDGIGDVYDVSLSHKYFSCTNEIAENMKNGIRPAIWISIE